MVHVLSYFQRSALPRDLRMSLLSHYFNLLIFHKHLVEKALFPYALTRSLFGQPRVSQLKVAALGPSKCAVGHRSGEFCLYPKHLCQSSSETRARSSFILPTSACFSCDHNNSIPDHQVGYSLKLGPLSTHLAITKPPRAIPDLLFPSTNSHPSLQHHYPPGIHARNTLGILKSSLWC